MAILQRQKALNGYNLVDALAAKGWNDYDLLTHYVTEFKGFTKPINSNIRSGDKNASLRFINKGGKTVISDFGYKVGMTVYDYLAEYLSLSKEGVYSLINRDFKLKLIDYTNTDKKVALRPQNSPKKHGIDITSTAEWDIRYRSREWDSFKVDKEFWFDRYGIQKSTLELFNVIPVSDWWLQNGDYSVRYIPNEANPTYIYLPHKNLGVKGFKRKVYSPFSTDRKWVNSLPSTVSLALHTLPEQGEVLILETSLKDTMTGYELFKEEDVWFTDLFSESVFLTKSLFEHLKTRFKLVLYHGDNDEPGIRQAKLFNTEYGVDYFVNPIGGPKDTSDMRHYKGYDYTKLFLTNEINKRHAR